MEEKQYPVIYLRGVYGMCHVWYRICFEDDDKDDSKRDRQKVDRVAVFDARKEGVRGGRWAVIGEDIYLTGGFKPPVVSKDLHKHDTAESDPMKWETISSRKLPRPLPFVFAVGKKIYALSGTALSDDDRNCGEFYDIDRGIWQVINFGMAPFCRYTPLAFVVKPDGTEPTEVVYFSVDSMLFLDVASGESHTSAGHHSFAAFWVQSNYPNGVQVGLQCCDEKDIAMLYHSVQHARATFYNHTFYWFTPDLHLYGYDINFRSWFRSPCLREKFPARYPRCCPILVALPNKKLVLILSEGNGEITMASLWVDRKGMYLNVRVEYIRAYSLDADTILLDGSAIVIEANDAYGDSSEALEVHVGERTGLQCRAWFLLLLSGSIPLSWSASVYCILVRPISCQWA